MSLFKESDFNKQEKDFTFFQKDYNNRYISSTNDYLRKHIGEIKEGLTYHCTSNGKWAMYNLTGYIIKQIGISDIIRTTYAISADAARYYIRLAENSLIRNMIYVIDNSAKQRNKNALKLMKCFNIKFSNVHAKLALISNDEIFITIKGSGNDTSGNRVEDFTIFTDKKVFDFYSKVILNDIVKV